MNDKAKISYEREINRKLDALQSVVRKVVISLEKLSSATDVTSNNAKRTICSMEEGIMERINFIREQLAFLTPSEMLDVVAMIRYRLGANLGILPAGPREKYDDLCVLVAKWEEKRR